MVLKNISVSYGDCPSCGSHAYISGYYPSDVHNIPALKRLVTKKCSDCGCDMTIKRIEMRVSIKDLK
jgi:hypothetical protein